MRKTRRHALSSRSNTTPKFDLVSSGQGTGVTSGGGDPVSSGPGGGVVSGGGGGVISGGSAFAMRIAAPNVSDPSMRRADLTDLHPLMRDAVTEVLKSCQVEGLPFCVFEAFRNPVRQNWLYGQGRNRDKQPIVTYAKAWESYHQYGLAADFVLYINNQWSWNMLGVNAARWKRLHEIGAKFGLEKLGFEAPHLQVSGLKLADLQAGKFPPHGDDSWRDNLEGAVISWHGEPAAPPMASSRPELSEEQTQTAGASG
jgi:D-alanyl-D-alanine carboxypeptidase